MSTPITISLLRNGRQKDYKAFFTDKKEALQFKVMIDGSSVCFEGGLNKLFTVKSNAANHTNQPLDPAIIEAVSHQLNQIFY